MMTEVPEALKAKLTNCPFAELLALNLDELTPGYARVSVKLGPQHANFLGTLDGAFITALADHASACASSSFGQTVVGLQLNLHFVSTTPLTGELIAESRALHAGRTIILTDITVTNGGGKVIARGTATSISRPSTALG